MTNDTLKVIVVDRHRLVREGLRRILDIEANIKVIGIAGNDSAAVDLANELHPDVVILDVTLPEVEGTTQRLLKETEAEVLILAPDCEINQTLRLLAAGAVGYLAKDATPQDLILAVHHVSRGEMALGPTTAREVVNRLTHLRPHIIGAIEAELKEVLTEREAEVLQLLCQGDSDKEIARKLRISTRTVNGHLRHIYAKLGIHSRTEAMHLALEKGWVSLTMAIVFVSQYLPSLT